MLETIAALKSSAKPVNGPEGLLAVASIAANDAALGKMVDDALTRPWSVSRTYHRKRETAWLETICGEDEHQVKIGQEQYFLSGYGNLMPTRKDQPLPDLKNFN